MAPIADPSRPPEIVVSPERLQRLLATIAGERNLLTSPTHHAATADLIRERFLAAGLKLVEQAVPSSAGAGRNLIGRLPGAENPDRTWILGAHYDTVTGTPGADDNGIAVAGLLEAARLLSGRRFRDTIELVAWDLEEPQPWQPVITRGSRRMARQARAQKAQIEGVIVLEMIGCCRTEPGSQRFPPGFGLLFPKLRSWVAARDNRGDFLAVVGNHRSSRLFSSLQAAAETTNVPLGSILVSGAARLVPDFYRSDHAPFWSRGYPAVMLTDTANFRNQHYHQPTDTIETVDLEFAAKVMSTALLALVQLAGGY
jgi:Zn-dependent M28 family amino/carboxypeptidase